MQTLITALRRSTAARDLRGPVAVSADADGDGMPDRWERAHGLNSHSPRDAAEDADGDGIDNLDEVIAGTDPVTPDPTPEPTPDPTPAPVPPQGPVP